MCADANMDHASCKVSSDTLQGRNAEVDAECF